MGKETAATTLRNMHERAKWTQGKSKGFNTEGTENTEFTEKTESPAKKWLNERDKTEWRRARLSA